MNVSKEIPEHWLGLLARRTDIEDLAARLFKRLQR
jgi:hypothetical protein